MNDSPLRDHFEGEDSDGRRISGRVIQLDDAVTLVFLVDDGAPSDIESFQLAHRTAEGPANALSPDSIVGQLLLNLCRVGDRVRYEGNPNRRGCRRSFEFEVLAVEPASFIDQRPERAHRPGEETPRRRTA